MVDDVADKLRVMQAIDSALTAHLRMQADILRESCLLKEEAAKHLRATRKEEEGRYKKLAEALAVENEELHKKLSSFKEAINMLQSNREAILAALGVDDPETSEMLAGVFELFSRE